MEKIGKKWREKDFNLFSAKIIMKTLILLCIKLLEKSESVNIFKEIKYITFLITNNQLVRSILNVTWDKIS